MKNYKQLKVIADARSLNRENIRGIGRYLFEIVTRTYNDFNVNWHLVMDRPDLPIQIEERPGIRVHCFDLKGYRFHTWEQVALPFMAKKLNAHILFCPENRGPFIQPIKTIITIHDIIPWISIEPDWPKGFYKDRLLPSCYRKSDRVITVSKNSQNDILSLWPALAKKLSVVSNGIGDFFIKKNPDNPSTILDGCGVGEYYILYLGGADDRKRLYWAMQVFENIDDLNHTLVLCGVNRHEAAKLSQHHCPAKKDRVICLPFIEDKYMPGVYKNATCVLYPTLYEGFGFPVIESQAVNTPILYSNSGSLSEFNGPNSIILPEDDLQAWIDMCTTLVRQAQNNGSVKAKQSSAWAKGYSWDESALKHYKIFCEL